MKAIFFIIFALFGLLQSNQSCERKNMDNSDVKVLPTPPKQTKFDRLPENITLQTQVMKDVLDSKGKAISSEVMTVEKRLNELKAKYKKGKLVDGKGREIRFYDSSCGGVSQPLEENQKEQKDKAVGLADLKKKYTVIVLACDPSKL